MVDFAVQLSEDDCLGEVLVVSASNMSPEFLLKACRVLGVLVDDKKEEKQ